MVILNLTMVDAIGAPDTRLEDNGTDRSRWPNKRKPKKKNQHLMKGRRLPGCRAAEALLIAQAGNIMLWANLTSTQLLAIRLEVNHEVRDHTHCICA